MEHTQSLEQTPKNRGIQPIEPARRVVLLGASNLTRGLPTVLQTARTMWRQPLEILAAAGHGRSYGQHSSCLMRSLDGITGCGLWDALSRREPAPAAALLTDVGNDIIYGVPVPRIVEWVEVCLDRLEAAQCRVILTLLPTCNIGVVGTRRFHWLMKALYPGYYLNPRVLTERVLELDQALRRMGHARSIPTIEPRREWYGFDPIHIQGAQAPRVWREILSHWNDGQCAAVDVLDADLPDRSWRHWLHVRTLAPERRWLCGLEMRRAQPAGRLPDGTSVALY